ncbi:hypothetical protein MPTK1_4g19690 [Marchantia polymorpha subsp. ruderalis]|uniref:Secreted protein n=2 Tax=Marchantia polymorpha TaxID=3197 RepID=A0AAF6BBP9_MARPO|nr:hypothetical protein MARPO_0126s0025 [Marchantia polymorpha]BBN09433.1 hypothetical protein Mp_4g19690 [Marchantia polymorpha subsp. ruderalis]|eukprot:PTQ30309.1 hypothetical protein MARPO_0126s0025 [Marchantia polymorpha]
MPATELESICCPLRVVWCGVVLAVSSSGTCESETVNFLNGVTKAQSFQLSLVWVRWRQEGLLRRRMCSQLGHVQEISGPMVGSAQTRAGVGVPLPAAFAKLQFNKFLFGKACNYSAIRAGCKVPLTTPSQKKQKEENRVM